MHAFSVVVFCFCWLFYEPDYMLSSSNVVGGDLMTDVSVLFKKYFS